LASRDDRSASPGGAYRRQGLPRCGVDVKMITGDHPSTAAAIAREFGLAGAGRAIRAW